MAQLGTLSIDFLVNLQNSLNQVGQLENRIAELERTARDSRRAVDDIGNSRVGNIAGAFDDATGAIDRFRGGLQGVLTGQGGLGDLLGAFQGIPPQALLAAGSVVAITGAVVGLGIAIQSSLSSLVSQGDELDKASQAAGVSVENLQQLRYAAGMSGIEADKLADAFKEVNNALGEGKEGEKAKIFEKLGISITDATGKFKTADQLLIESADSFAKLGSDQERAILAMKLFGEEGKNLVPLLKQGSDAVREQMKEHDALGATLGGDTVKAAAEFNDQMSRVGTLLEGLKHSFAEMFLPSAKLVVDVFLELAKSIRGSLPDGESFKGLVLDITRSGLRLLLQAIDATVKKINQFGRVLIVVAPLIEMVFNNVMFAVDGLRILINALDVFKGFVQANVLTVVKALIDAFGGLVGAMANVAGAVGLDSVAEGARGAQTSIQAMSSAIASIKSDTVAGMKTDLDDVFDAAGSVIDRFKNLGSTTKLLQGVGQKAADLTFGTASANDALIDALKENTEANNKNTEGSLDLSNVITKEGEKDRKDRKASKEKAEKLTVPQQFERLTGKSFPDILKKDPEGLRIAEEFIERRKKAEEDFVKTQNELNKNLKNYNGSIKAIDGSLKSQNEIKIEGIAVEGALVKSQGELIESIDRGKNAQEKSAAASIGLAKKQKELTQRGKDLEEAQRQADITEQAFGAVGGFGGGAAGGGAVLGRLAKAQTSSSTINRAITDFIMGAGKSIDEGKLGSIVKAGFEKLLNSQYAAVVKLRAAHPTLDAGVRSGILSEREIARSLAAEKTVAGIGATTGASAGGAAGLSAGQQLGRAFSGYDKILADQQQLNKEVKEYQAEIAANNELIKEGKLSEEETVRLKARQADLSIALLELEQEQDNLAKQRVALEGKAAKAKEDGVGNVISLAQQLLGITREQTQATVELDLLAADVNRILQLRTEIATNERDLNEDAAAAANASKFDEIKRLEIRRQDVSEAERKVLYLEQEVEYGKQLNQINNNAVEKAREAADRAREQVQELANRNNAARLGLEIEKEKDPIQKAELENKLKLQELNLQNLTALELELEKLKLANELEAEKLDILKEQAEERAKGVEQIAGGLGGASSVAGGLGDLIAKIGGAGKEDDLEFQDMLRQIDNVSGALGGLSEASMGVARIMSGDLIGGITGLMTGLMSTVGSVYDFFFGETEEEKKAREEREKIEEEARFDDVSQIFFDNAALRQQAEEFAKAFVSEQERRMGRPVEITIDARGALIGEENEVARALGNLLETELGRRVGNVGIGRF